ncbi:hypothetical protein L0657_01905 [Dyadobacter sp. CY345]|uniref:immunoglobulin domain-containing protein n=1 Tax=Dyadobacter sp. CY345 TaxID=2909335 RepID=UPI001F1D9598|nr:hypothetical protein [Dyadobacter sp. CY345]MCF2442694.1 hypothetical protein [Dyadobacter sp. CY345]
MKKAFYLNFLVLVIGTLLNVAVAQPGDAVYASSATGGGVAPGPAILPTGTFLSDSVNNAANVAGNVKPNSKAAHLSVRSTAGVASAWIQLAFASQVPANSTSYIKISNYTGTGTISVQTYTSVSGTGSPVSPTPAAYKTYFTSDGNQYLAITPSVGYRSVRVTLASGTLLSTSNVDVYYAFYGPTAVNDSNPFPFNVADCGSANVSTVGISGLSVGSFGVANPGSAIDGDATGSGSSFYATGLTLLSGHIFQTFYFNGPSNAADAVRIIFSKNGAFLAASLASSVKIQGYNGADAVGSSQPFSALLDVSLLSSLNTNNNKVTAYFAPKDASGTSVIFDRVTVDLDIGLLGLTLGASGLNIFDVRRVPDVPVTSDKTVCSNVGIVSLSALASQTNLGLGFIYKWYDAIRDGSLLQEAQNYTVSGLTTAGQNRSYFVDIQKSGCPVTSARNIVNVTVTEAPITPPIALTP